MCASVCKKKMKKAKKRTTTTAAKKKQRILAFWYWDTSVHSTEPRLNVLKYWVFVFGFGDIDNNTEQL